MALPQIVLTPGLMNDAALWEAQVAGLSDVARPGVADITRAATLSDLAGEVLAIAEDRFALAGFSLGRIVALEVARIARDRLALLGTTMLPDSPERAVERERLVATALAPGADLVARVLAIDAAARPEVFVSPEPDRAS